MVRNVADIYQSGQYSIEAQKVKRAQGALKLNLSISSSARTQINSIWDYYANQKH